MTTTIDDTTYRTLAPRVHDAAFIVSGKWPWIIDDYRDLEQDIWVRLLDAGQHTIDVLMSMDKSNQIVTLKEIGHQIASRQRDDYETFSGNYKYGTDEVRKALGKGILLEADNAARSIFDKPEIPEDKSSNDDKEVSCMRADIYVGLDRLQKKNADYVYIIGRAYLSEDSLDSTERKTLTRAVDALVREMNRSIKSAHADHSGGPGSRTSWSNAKSLAEVTG